MGDLGCLEVEIVGLRGASQGNFGSWNEKLEVVMKRVVRSTIRCFMVDIGIYWMAYVMLSTGGQGVGIFKWQTKRKRHFANPNL